VIVHQPRATREGERVGPGRVQLVTGTGGRLLEPPPLPPDQRDGPTHFLCRLRTGGDVTDLCAADVGRDVQEVIAAALRSSERGRPVALPLTDV
jgi:predicted dehydrogenase